MPDVDVIVLGSGFAGLRAAVAASAAGASVLVVEALGEIGGRSRFSWANIMGAGTRFQKELGIQDSAEAMYEQYMRLNAFQLDASVAWALCSGTGPEIEWLADNGAEIRGVVPNESFEVPRIHRTGGGQQLIDLLLKLARAQGVDFANHDAVQRGHPLRSDSDPKGWRWQNHHNHALGYGAGTTSRRSRHCD
jgi:fumarate reductase flavoprotein subunit